jgi:MFS family permease
MMLQMACSNTLIQTMVPDQLRGRVMALYSMMFMGMAPFGAFFGGALAHRMGAPVTVAVGGVLCVIGAIWFGRALPSLRIEARRLIIAQGLSGGEPEQELNAQPVEELGAGKD